ncbi:MAG: S-layer homology domain-containing protein [Acidimicrobiales bacterium]
MKLRLTTLVVVASIISALMMPVAAAETPPGEADAQSDDIISNAEPSAPVDASGQVATLEQLDIDGLVAAEKPPSTDDDLSLSVVGGAPANVADYPHVGAVVSVNIFDYIQNGPAETLINYCTTSFLGEFWAISAAHCWEFVDANEDDLNDNLYWTIFGQSNVVDPLSTLLFETLPANIDSGDFTDWGPFGFPFSLTQHPDYSILDYDQDGQFEDNYADLMLIELDSISRSAEPIAYNGDLFHPSKYAAAQVAGFGITSASQTDFQDRLQAGSTTILSESFTTFPDVAELEDFVDRCGQTRYIRGAHLCAGDLDDGLPSACFGDSGGPLQAVRFAEPLLVGVTSTLGDDPSEPETPTCGNATFPARFTNVAGFSPWINSMTGVAPADLTDCPYNGYGSLYLSFEVPCWTDQTSHPFRDVTALWMQKGVGFLSANAITTGKSPTAFAPNDPATRGEAAAFLARFAQVTDISVPPHPFNDVSASWQQRAVSWLAFYDITTGKTPSTFVPNDRVTRAEFVTFLWRLAGSPTVSDPNHGFIDVVAGPSWWQLPVAWAKELGITTGKPAGSATFSPNGDVTRAEIAAFLERFARTL